MNSLEKKINHRYILFVSICLVFFVVAFFVVKNQVSTQKKDAYLINISGKQRMLSQRISKIIYTLNENSQQIPREKSLTKLQALSVEFKNTHEFLYNDYITSNRNKKLDSLFKLTEKGLAVIIQIGDSIVTNNHTKLNKKSISNLAINERSFLDSMDALVNEYQKLAENNLTNLTYKFYLFFAIGLLILIVGFFILLTPIIKQLVKKGQQLSSSNKELLHSKMEVENNLKEVKKLRAEIEIKDKYNKIFIEQAPPSIAMLDKDMKYIAVSKKWKLDYNLKNQDLIGKSHYDIFPEIGEEWKQKHQRCLKGEVNVCDKASFTRADGSVQWLFWDIRPWYLSDNEIGGLLMYTGDITKTVEERKAKEKTEIILESTTKVAKIGVWELDLKTEKYTLGKTTRDILEFPDDYEIYANDSIKYYKEGVSRNKILKHVKELILTGKPFDVEVEVVTYNGKSKWIRDIGQAEFEGDRCIRLFGVFQDITHIKESGNQLLRQNHVLNIAEEINLMGHWHLNINTKEVKWSSGLYEIMGFEKDSIDVNINTIFDITHPDDLDLLKSHMEKTIAEKTFKGELVNRIISQDGTIKTISLLGKVYTDQNGNITEIIGTCQDITHQRIAEIKFKGLLESAPDAMIILDKQKNIHLINKQAEKLFGYSSLELIDKNIDILISNKIIDDFIAYRDNYFENTESIKQGETKELMVVNKKGDMFPVQISLSPLETESGLLVSVAIRNITEQKEAEQKIINANLNLRLLANKLTNQNTQLADFAQITSHNLRAPVSNLNSLIDIYKISESNEDKNEVFENFEKVINHLTTTLNILVDALKVKNVTASKVEVTFSKTLNKTKELLASQIIKANAEITSNFSQVDTINYNKIYFESIVLNLVENAIKYRSKDRIAKIHLESFLVNNKVILKITDNGLGINLKKHGNKLFGLNKVFHRHPDAKGVGLFMTKLHIESMGGTITADSIENEGTTFIINLN